MTQAEKKICGWFFFQDFIIADFSDKMNMFSTISLQQ